MSVVVRSVMVARWRGDGRSVQFYERVDGSSAVVCTEAGRFGVNEYADVDRALAWRCFHSAVGLPGVVAGCRCAACRRV